jgi:hypothetical protein
MITAGIGFGKTYKLFSAIQSLSGTTPYQQLPAQLVWSQRRMPPMFRFVRGLARAVVAFVVRRRVARKSGSMVGFLGGFVDVLEMDRWRFGGCGVLVLPARFPLVV